MYRFTFDRYVDQHGFRHRFTVATRDRALVLCDIDLIAADGTVTEHIQDAPYHRPYELHYPVRPRSQATLANAVCTLTYLARLLDQLGYLDENFLDRVHATELGFRMIPQEACLDEFLALERLRKVDWGVLDILVLDRYLHRLGMEALIPAALRPVVSLPTKVTPTHGVLAQPCPQCGKGALVYHGDQVVCSYLGCRRGTRESLEAATSPC